MHATAGVDVGTLIGEGLAQARHEARLSARGLAALCSDLGVRGIDRNRVTNLELGRGRPVGVQELLALAYVLQVWPGDLITGRRREPAEIRVMSGSQRATSPAARDWDETPIRLAADIAVTRDVLGRWLMSAWPAWRTDATPPPPELPPPLEDIDEIRQLARRLAVLLPDLPDLRG